jgi:hypothetical protein
LVGIEVFEEPVDSHLLGHIIMKRNTVKFYLELHELGELGSQSHSDHCMRLKERVLDAGVNEFPLVHEVTTLLLGDSLDVREVGVRHLVVELGFEKVGSVTITFIGMVSLVVP